MFPSVSSSDPPSQQTFDECHIFKLDEFVQSLLSGASDWQHTPEDIRELKWALSALKSKSPENNGPPHVRWLGEHGCALLTTMSCIGTLVLTLVCLDGWEFCMHGGPVRKHSSLCGINASKSLYVGTVPLVDFDTFWEDFEELMANAERRTCENRSAANGQQGNQSTPAMIQAVMKDALTETKEKTLPRGGFTDVGLHTGGSRRNTAWPLVRAVLQILLDSKHCHRFYRIVMAQFKLFCIETSDMNDLDTVMEMLQETALEGLTLSDPALKYDIKIFEDSCAHIRAEVDRKCSEQGKAFALKFVMANLQEIVLSFRNIVLPVPSESSPTCTDSDLDRARSLARQNIGSVPVHQVSASWKELLLWLEGLKLQQNSVTSTMLLAKSIIERFAFEAMASLNLGGDISSSYTSTPAVIDEVVDQYCLAVATVLKSNPENALLETEIRSCELLVLWIAACVVHQLALNDPIAILKEYSFPLNIADLRYPVLSEKSAIDAAVHVAAYIHRVNAAAKHKCIFSLRYEDETVHFATHYAEMYPVANLAWETESAAAKRAKERHWNEVLLKQNDLKILDSELANLMNDCDNMLKRLSTYEVPRLHGYNRTSINNDNNYNETYAKISTLRLNIESKRKEISSVEIPPKPIVQSLPRDESLAWPIVFFLYMPRHFQTLSRLLFMAQQKLLPTADKVSIAGIEGHSEIDVKRLIEVTSPHTTWYEYYLEHKVWLSSRPVQNKVVLGSMNSKVSGDWFPKNVRDYSSADQGVWYPDSLQPKLFWSGGSHLDRRKYYFDPFASLPHEVYIHTFTEQLPEEYQSLQWAMTQSGYETRPQRSNWPEAVEDDMVGGKVEHLSFGSIKAFPNPQLRKLCVILRERSLPLDKPAVHSLLRQTLYQLGDLSDEEIPQSLWWRDCQEQRDGLSTLCTELEALREDLQNMLRYHGAILILGELAAFASQWHSPCRDVARGFARITRDWADQILVEIGSASIDKIAELRARRCLFTMCSLNCHSTGELSCEDVREILDNIFISENTRLFDETTSYTEKVRALTVVTRNIISRRLHIILRTLDEHPEYITSSCKLILEQTPLDLVWHRYGPPDTQCYEAVSSTHDLFSVNVLTGVVLFNGLPPCRLPSSVTSNQMYVRSFGDHNFEVVTNVHHIMRTARSIKGFYYEFYVTDRLVVREIDSDGNVLELLDGTEDGIQIWGEDLPWRLQMMYSHWLSRQSSTLILRSKSFDQRDISFLCKQDTLVVGSFSCYRVPENLSAKTWLELSEEPLLSTFDKLVVESNPRTCPILKILGKFELDCRLIHVYSTGGGEDSTTFELPRFGLSFTLKSNDDALKSNDYRGFQLSKSQAFEDNLRGFTQYLILEDSMNKGLVMVLLPAGSIVREANITIVKGPESCDTEHKHHCYRLHQRFGKLEIDAGPLAVEGRLQLAAIYASIDSKVPYQLTRQTGSEIAIELVRQSWVNRPLLEKECDHLKSICVNTRFSCSLVLLCYDLFESARALEFLFIENLKRRPSTIDIIATDAATQYSLRKKSGNLNPREFLTEEEEARVLGLPVHSMTFHYHESIPDSDCILAEHPQIETIEDKLRGMAGRNEEGEGREEKRGDEFYSTPFPLESSYFNDSEIGRATLSELRNSWDAYQDLQVSPAGLAEAISSFDLGRLVVMKEQVTLHREEFEFDLLRFINNNIPDRTSSGFKMRRAANLLPVAVIGDLAKMLLSPDDLRIFNPFLTNETQKGLLSSISLLLQYCVFEDKLNRMCSAAMEDNMQEFLREQNEIGRSWRVQDYPEWLVFEFEQGIQIRRIQNVVAQHLIKNPGAIAQLNMGEGKTRLILPMLILSMANQNSLVRLHFLSALLGEVYEYLHRHLTASLFLRRLYLLPFQRNIKLSEDDALTIYENLQRCKDSRGAVCIAPEHRLSLELKWHELYATKNHTLCSLLRKIQQLPYLDIIDESDEILRHKFQLIYAVGSCMPLPDGSDRWIACQAVLWQLQSSDCRSSDTFRRVSSRRGAGTFDDIRLIPGEAADEYCSALKAHIAWRIMDDPPYHMRWLADTSQNLRAAIVKFVISPCDTGLLQRLADVSSRLQQFAADPFFTGSFMESNVKQSQLLALRGLLAYGIFEHCLAARYRVDYGIDERRGVKHRTAVPYRASDSPSERSEYKHPEMILFLTILSYYHEGMSRSEMKEAVTKLLSHESIAQRLEYELWVSSARPTMTQEQLDALDTIAKLDVTNELQTDLLHKVFGYNMAAINFWLNNCVFPAETKQFPQSLIANAFHLADNSHGGRGVVGFSGTKDNYLLLPHQVQQSMDVHPELTATDGKMLDLLGPKNSQPVVVIDDSIHVSDGVLDLAGRGYNSLIDAGGTMAGLSNREVANRMLKLLNRHRSSLKGVIYFDVVENTWYIIDRERERCLPKGSSPIGDSEAFVYFDESRCRGADMKLSSDAHAVLTIGTCMCKDKLIQAAGRMRKLQFGQKITMAVLRELVPKINRNGTDSVTPIQVLNWVLQNTVEAVKEGLSEWGAQGIYFATSMNDDARLLDEKLTLDSMYSTNIEEQTIKQTVDDLHNRALQRTNAHKIKLNPKSLSVLQTVLHRAGLFGSDVKMKSIRNEQECERELEEERHTQREKEVQIPRQDPATPLEWRFCSILSANGPKCIDPAAGVVSLTEAVTKYLHPSLSDINWHLCRIFVTRNFMETVISQLDNTPLEDLSDYMRPADAVLVFQSGDCLLLSEWEADKILGLLWEAETSSSMLSSCKVCMCPVSYLLQAADNSWISPPKLFVPKRSGSDFRPSELTLAALSLLGGGTMFRTPARKAAVMELLRLRAGKGAAPLLPTLRGLPHMIARSDLEDICAHTMH